MKIPAKSFKVIVTQLQIDLQFKKTLLKLYQDESIIPKIELQPIREKGWNCRKWAAIRMARKN